MLEIDGAHNPTHSRAKRECGHREALALALAVNWTPEAIRRFRRIRQSSSDRRRVKEGGGGGASPLPHKGLLTETQTGLCCVHETLKPQQPPTPTPPLYLLPTLVCTAVCTVLYVTLSPSAMASFLSLLFCLVSSSLPSLNRFTTAHY